jgi:hypothetical protein
MSPDPPVSEQRLAECVQSARFWTSNLARYADRMQTLADRYAIAAAAISTVTGLAVWGTISSSVGLWGQVAVSLMAFAAAAAAFIPKTKGYGECAVKASSLSSDYGHVYGTLLDASKELQSGDSEAQTHARRAVDAFEAVRAEKQRLRPYPSRLQQQIDSERGEGDALAILKAIQRIYRLTTSAEEVEALLAAGLDSAADIVTIGHDGFRRRLAGAIDEERQDQIYARAQDMQGLVNQPGGP